MATAKIECPKCHSRFTLNAPSLEAMASKPFLCPKCGFSSSFACCIRTAYPHSRRCAFGRRQDTCRIPWQSRIACGRDHRTDFLSCPGSVYSRTRQFRQPGVTAYRSRSVYEPTAGRLGSIAGNFGHKMPCRRPERDQSGLCQ